MESEARDSKEPLGRCGSYELLVELASGGMATVYLARATDRLGAPLVAVKRPHRHLAKDKLSISMLVDEARLASAIKHDNVVKVRELGFESGEPFIVMDYVEGASLSDVRRELSALGRAIDPRFAVRIAIDALAGLGAAHELKDEQGQPLGIVHRDVSPHNVLIGCDGVTRLTDFGIAKAQDRQQVTKTHEVKGKLAYLAPERIDKRRICTAQSDVFSMATVLWECIAGRRLFRGEEAIETLQEVMTGPIPSLRKIGVPISEILDEVILKGLARDLDERYPSARAFADALVIGAGRANIASPHEIATLIEALFGERLRVRHADIREALLDGDVDSLLEVSGLNPRPMPTEEMRERQKLAIESIAPPAPSARYAFGNSSGGILGGRFATPFVKRAAIVAFGASAVLGTAFVVMSRGSKADTTLAAAEQPLFRRVVVPLPFPATKVSFDEQSRELLSPTDTVAFDVPRESGQRHRVTALAADGSHAEAFVREEDGVAKPEGAGFVIEALETYGEDAEATTVIELPPTPNGVKRVKKTKPPPPPPVVRPKPAPSASAKPVSTTKDGFTKLK